MTTETVLDPHLTPAATYAVEPSVVRGLTARAVIDGTGGGMTTITPMTGAPLAAIPYSSVADVDRAVAAGRTAAKDWAAMPVAERAKIFLRYHDLVLDKQDRLLDLIQLESGKARAHAFEEVADVAIVSRHYARRAADYLRPNRRGPGAYPVLSQSVESHHPKGVVGIVGPWNYPLSMSITDAIPALIAGNAVVLRPDVQATLTALTAVALLDRAGLPPGVLQVVLGRGVPIGQAVVDRTDYVCFTGSTETGRTVAASAGQRLIGASLELGGKNSMYVADDADVDRSVEIAVRGCFSSAGQLCVSMERLLVHDGIYDAFMPKFIAAVQAMRLGNSLSFGYDMGSLISESHLLKVQEHVDDAVAKGATVLAGGKSRPDLGPFIYEPTVLTNVSSAMACRDEETFGPVVSVYRVASDEAAIALANDSEYGLNASILTGDVGHGRALAARIKAGTVNINEAYAAAWGSVASPMGGMKASGLGRRHGREGILKYTESQNVTAQYVLGFGPPFGLTDATFAKTLTVALKAMKRIGFR